MMDVHRKFRLRSETLYVAQYIIDKYLSLKKIANKSLHLLGVTTLHLAAKYEEIYPPDMKDFITVSENKFKKEDILATEKDILHELQFDVTSPSPYRFLQRFVRLNESTNDEEVLFFAQYILEISLLEAKFIMFRPSVLAAAALVLSAKQIKGIDNLWDARMQKLTTYSSSDL